MWIGNSWGGSVRNKTIIGLKCFSIGSCLSFAKVRNKTIIGLKY